jgi:AraC-like DNA-binding protein
VGPQRTGYHHGMAVEVAELPLRRHVLFESRDCDEARDRVGEVFCPHELQVLGKGGRVDARQHLVPFGRASISYLSYGAEVRIDPQCLRSFYLVQVPLWGSARIRSGPVEFESSTRLASVINPSSTLRMNWSGDCGQLIVRFERAFVEALVASYLGRAVKRELRFDAVFDCSSAGGRRWVQFVRQLICLIESGPAAPLGPLATRQLEQALLAMLLETQPHDHLEMLASMRAPCAPRHVRRAEEFIVANAAEAIGVEDIVEASGASMRTLYEGFRRFRGTSPMEFLRASRLARVREDLMRARAGTKVSEVAARWGFYQFGRFAARYRELYGERPSETLHRALSAPE